MNTFAKSVESDIGEMMLNPERYLAERQELKRRLTGSPRGLKAQICKTLNLHPPTVLTWLNRGTGMAEAKLAPLLEWIRHGSVEDLEPTQPREYPVRPDEYFAQRDKPQRELVAEAIRRSGITQHGVATLTGVSASHLGKWLKSGRNLSPRKSASVIKWAQKVVPDFELPVETTPDNLPEISAFPVAILKQIATNDALARATGEQGDTLPGESAADIEAFSPAPEPTLNHCLEAPMETSSKIIPFRRQDSPGDAIICGILHRAARAALENIAPDLAPHIEIDLALRWGVAEAGLVPRGPVYSNGMRAEVLR
jgi:transcriptional regulator with XRE-family HTH domain